MPCEGLPGTGVSHKLKNEGQSEERAHPEAQKSAALRPDPKIWITTINNYKIIMTNANGTLHWPGTILSPLRVLNHLILFAQLPGSPFLFGGIYTLNFFECRHRLLEAERRQPGRWPCKTGESPEILRSWGLGTIRVRSGRERRLQLIWERHLFEENSSWKVTKRNVAQQPPCTPAEAERSGGGAYWLRNQANTHSSVHPTLRQMRDLLGKPLTFF